MVSNGEGEACLEEYTRSLVGQEGVRLRFRLRTGSEKGGG